MMGPDEATSWNLIQQKDGQAFERYYKENYSCFFLMACKYMRDPASAQEIVNDVFVKLWQDGHDIQISSSLKSYIYRAVINRSINALNRRKKEMRLEKELSSQPAGTVEMKHMEDNELKLRLYKAIDELPEQARKVFMMSRFEELKQQEIADRLGISIKTVKNHITYALKNLNTVVGSTLILLLLLLLKAIAACMYTISPAIFFESYWDCGLLFVS